MMMYRTRIVVLLTALWAISLPAAMGQVLDFGSDGSDGAFEPLESTEIDLSLAATASWDAPSPVPGQGVYDPSRWAIVFKYTTINIPAGVSVTFKNHPNNPPVYWLATGDILIGGTVNLGAQAGTVSPPVSGQGGPGGFSGGMPGFGDAIPPGSGLGPGGGLGGETSGATEFLAGRGVYGFQPGNLARPTDGTVYGSSLLVPMVGGSGGGGTVGQPGYGGGGGGGAILLASNTEVNVPSGGVVIARGATGWSATIGSGSGGAIRVLAPVVTGSGTLDVYGPSGITSTSGAGRIRVDAIDRTGLQFFFNPSTVTAVGTLMFVFSDVVPRLDIIEAAGEVIPEDQPEPIMVLLPFGSTSDHTVVVQARDFTGVVPIVVAVIPESGDPLGDLDERFYFAEITMGKGDVGSVTVDVVIPVNTATHIMAWTQ